MSDKFRKNLEKLKDNASNLGMKIGDLNGDGKVDSEDIRIASEWSKDKTKKITKIGKNALNSDFNKDVATCAAIGAAIAIPIPLIGPSMGAAIGAGVGVYKNLTKKSEPLDRKEMDRNIDKHAELLKIKDLRDKEIISDEEFEVEKKKILQSDGDWINMIVFKQMWFILIVCILKLVEIPIELKVFYLFNGVIYYFLDKGFFS